MSAQAAKDFISSFSSSVDPQLAPEVELMKTFYEKKLWHQLTVALENFVNHTYWRNTRDERLMTELYERFIKEFEVKMNQLKLVKVALAIVSHFSNPQTAVNFLQKLVDKIHPDAEKEAHALALSEIAHLKLTKLNQVEDSKVVADKVAIVLEKITGADPSVYSSYYRYLSLYYKLKVVPTEFYKNSLMYLVYTPLETIVTSEQQALAFDMGIAALVAQEIHNFGELLAHPVLNSLKSTNREWLLHFLYAFNSGDIDKFEKFLVSNAADIDAQPFLKANLQLLRQKISVLALMELVFNKPSDKRTLPFKMIADATKLPVDEVELLVMKALSLKLIKGSIDEVTSTATITWVQPRVLDLQQVAKMRDRVQYWIDTTNQTRSFMEGTTAPELLT